MKWTNEKVEILTQLVQSSHRPKEIANTLGFSEKSINCKMNRLGLKVLFTQTSLCKNCGNLFESYVKDERVFCSKSCSASFNNSNRTHTQETKDKISLKLKKPPKERIPKPPKERIPKEKPNRNCKICKEPKVSKKHKSICESCKTDYYQFYRHECNFKFNVFDYPNEFDLHLIKTHGWYSPTNKRNNLKGVSKDHMYSVMDGYKNKVSSEIISHPANCKLMLYSDNSRKKDSSSIRLEDLLKKISHWDKKYT